MADRGHDVEERTFENIGSLQRRKGREISATQIAIVEGWQQATKSCMCIEDCAMRRREHVLTSVARGRFLNCGFRCLLPS